ncbi:predicted protein [Plenodomus lingam JN3]|uniref:Predicted protein n=1 Tax=Leptosphaeria maculans (strain JN3 / isolate v23.1.3 / race Av1-4-5-6-7-8) TaxID=985895 RepID=E4ZJM5_LEPMJ|nr:predicted protein [Plenodomus lingam JN3]CBX91310.1 predicted protein [Plenodomus lingam JN3]
MRLGFFSINSPSYGLEITRKLRICVGDKLMARAKITAVPRSSSSKVSGLSRHGHGRATKMCLFASWGGVLLIT